MLVWKARKLLGLLLREVLGWLLDQGFELRLKVRERSLSWFLRGSKAYATGQQEASLVALLAWHHLQTRLHDRGLRSAHPDGKASTF